MTVARWGLGDLVLEKFQLHLNKQWLFTVARQGCLIAYRGRIVSIRQVLRPAARMYGRAVMESVNHLLAK